MEKEQQKEQQGFYRRPLPDVCVDFASAAGRALFAEALQASRMTCYFPLAAQFHTQSEPAYCGLGTLAMVLNALAIDPQRIWKGPWRWFSEELLDCCSPLEVVKKNGITISEFVCLARCNGAAAQPIYASESNVDQFREAVRECSARDDRLLVVSYDRRGLKQTGSGHFSPIGGYHPDKDMVLILDVARFKYPPHWVSLPTLFAAMQTIDFASQRSRGYISVTAAPQRPHIFSRIRAGSGEWAQLVDRLCNQLPALFAHNRPPQSAAADSPPPVVELPEFVATALAYITAPSPSLLTSASASSSSSCAISDFFSTYEKDLQDRMTVEHRRMVEQLFAEIHSTDIYRALAATDTTSSSLGSGGGGGGVACCRVSTVHDQDRKKPTTTTSSSSPAAIPGELATLILFLLLRQLDETKHHPQQQEQQPEAASSSTSSPAPACSSCTASPKQQPEPHDGCERAGEVRFGESVAAAFKQLDALPLVSGEVGYLWASFRNIAFFCACRDRRTPCH